MKALLAILPLLGIVGCTEGNPPPQTVASTGTTHARADGPRTCPLGVASAHVAYEETEGGAALVFTALPEQLADLRERARYASAIHGPGEKLGKGHDGEHGGGGDHGLKMMQMPVTRAGATDVEGGARIVFTPVDPHDLETLRAKLRGRARDLMSGCS